MCMYVYVCSLYCYCCSFKSTIFYLYICLHVHMSAHIRFPALFCPCTNICWRRLCVLIFLPGQMRARNFLQVQFHPVYVFNFFFLRHAGIILFSSQIHTHTVYPLSDQEFQFAPNVWMVFHPLVTWGIFCLFLQSIFILYILLKKNRKWPKWAREFYLHNIWWAISCFSTVFQ